MEENHSCFKSLVQSWFWLHFLSEPIDVQAWHLHGLAQDSFSEENTTLVINGQRWPICIDLQNQANQWIKKMFKEDLVVLTTKQIQKAMDQKSIGRINPEEYLYFLRGPVSLS